MTDRAAAILRRLSSAFRQDRDSNNYRIVRIQADELDEISAVIEDIVQAHNLEFSSGRSLDYLAELLELERNGLSDDDFRALIAATAVFRRSSGTIADIKNVVSSITGVPEDGIAIHEDGDTSFSIELQSPNQNPFSLTIFNQNVNDAKAAGVKYLADDLVMTLTPGIWISLVTREGAAWVVGKIMILGTSKYIFGNSEFGEATFGDPCMTCRTTSGTLTVV